MKKIILAVCTLLIALVIGLNAATLRGILRNIGIVKDEIRIAGTGSMYPTFPKGTSDNDVTNARNTVAWPKVKTYPGGINILGLHLFPQNLSFGDIVDFENATTDKISTEKYGEKAGFVKRIIGLPGDTIEIRDGFVFRNDELIKEPYTAKPRSTFGGSFLADCKKLTVLDGQIFVMGDNRKASLDSRHELSLVNIKDVLHFLPFQEQDEYKKLWRNTDMDGNTAHQVTLNTQNFVSLLNNKRVEEGVPQLKPNQLLASSAKSRAEIMIQTNDFSIEATQSGYTLEDAVKSSGYKNILFAETVSQGYYDEEELLENIFQFPETKKIAIDRQYQDIGIGVVLGEINACPVQAIVIHFGGYKPPNYSKDTIESWQKLVDKLNEVIPSWESLKENDSVDKDDLQKLLDSLYQRKANATRILDKMKNNLWLTDEENRLADLDEQLAKEEEEFIEKLNK